MDYIKLKKTLLAVFDHFLSCHDMQDLEKMMQAFEAGKTLSIQLPEKINRTDYKDDLQLMHASRPKMIRSRLRQTKAKNKPEISTQEKHICDIPILMNLAEITDEKKALIANILKFQKHKIIFKNYDASDSHGFATASIYHIIKEKNDMPQKQTHIRQSTSNLRGTSYNDRPAPKAHHISDRFLESEKSITPQSTPPLNKTYYNDRDTDSIENHNIFKAGTSFENIMHHIEKPKSRSQFRDMVIQEVRNRIKKQKDPP